MRQFWTLAREQWERVKRTLGENMQNATLGIGNFVWCGLRDCWHDRLGHQACLSLIALRAVRPRPYRNCAFSRSRGSVTRRLSLGAAEGRRH
jgi:hypothetical protein